MLKTLLFDLRKVVNREAVRRIFVFTALLSASWVSPALAQSPNCAEFSNAEPYQTVFDSGLSERETREKLRALGAVGQEIANHLELRLRVANTAEEEIESDSVEYLRDFSLEGVVDINKLKLALVSVGLEDRNDARLFMSRYITLRNLRSKFCDSNETDTQFSILSLWYEHMQRERGEPPSRDFVAAAREVALAGVAPEYLLLYSRMLNRTSSTVRNEELLRLYEITQSVACRDQQMEDCLKAFETLVSKVDYNSIEARLDVETCILNLWQDGKIFSVRICNQVVPKDTAN